MQHGPKSKFTVSRKKRLYSFLFLIGFAKISYITSKQLLLIINTFTCSVDIVIKKLFKKQKTLLWPLLHKKVYFYEKKKIRIFMKTIKLHLFNISTYINYKIFINFKQIKLHYISV